MHNANFADLIRPLNDALIPAVRLGFASPWLMAPGLVLVDVVGRKSGSVRETPLLANEVLGDLIVGTVREQSQWLRNLEVQDEAWVTIRGSRRQFAVGQAPQPLAAGLAQLSALGYRVIYLKRLY